MARTNNLSNYLTDVADAIKEKKGDDTPINASEFDDEIRNLPSGGSDFKITNCGYLFYNAYRSDEIEDILNNLVDKNNISNMYYFAYIQNVYTKIDYSKFINLNITNCTDLRYSFGAGSTSYAQLTNLDFMKTWKKSNDTYIRGDYMFNYQSKLTDVSGLDDFVFNSARNMFYNCASITSSPKITLSDEVLLPGYSSVNSSSMFYGCSKLTNISNITFDINRNDGISLDNMFYGCSKLTDISSLENTTIKASSNAQCMFYNCSSLEHVNLQNFTFKGYVYQMFYGCSKLKEARLPKLGVATRIQEMFYNCTSLQLIDIRNADIASRISSSSYYNNALYNVPTTVKIIVKDETEKTWWQGKFSAWSSCFYTPEEAIAAGIIDE